MGEHRCYQCGRTTFDGRTVKTYVGGRVLCKVVSECRQIAAEKIAERTAYEGWPYRPSDISLFRDNSRRYMLERERKVPAIFRIIEAARRGEGYGEGVASEALLGGDRE